MQLETPILEVDHPGFLGLDYFCGGRPCLCPTFVLLWLKPLPRKVSLLAKTEPFEGAIEIQLIKIDDLDSPYEIGFRTPLFTGISMYRMLMQGAQKFLDAGHTTVYVRVNNED